MSSWLERLARLYGMHVNDLLGPDLGVWARPVDLVDYDPPPEIFALLAVRTGVGEGQLRAMTLAGWAPWLFDIYPAMQRDAAEVFHTYVRGNSVLLDPRAASRPSALRRSWRGPWLSTDPLNRTCPRCTAETGQRALLWELPLTVGCTEHGCRLESASDALRTAIDPKDHNLEPIPIPEPLATLENYTHQALTTGTVQLPGRPVHAGVWFRLLRSLLDELSLALTTMNQSARRTLEQVWATAGLRARAGISVWRPYEHLPWDTQEKLLMAAAVAVTLVAERQIVARGTFGALLASTPHEPVYDGDDPYGPPTVSTAFARPACGFAVAMEEWLRTARMQPGPAGQMLQCSPGTAPPRKRSSASANT
jgi:hypothetical protein